MANTEQTRGACVYCGRQMTRSGNSPWVGMCGYEGPAEAPY